MGEVYEQKSPENKLSLLVYPCKKSHAFISKCFVLKNPVVKLCRRPICQVVLEPRRRSITCVEEVLAACREEEMVRETQEAPITWRIIPVKQFITMVIVSPLCSRVVGPLPKWAFH